MSKELKLWEAKDGSLHKTELEAVEADIVLLGGDDAYYDFLVKKLEECNERLVFNLNGFPERISYRLMYSGYIGQLYTPISNAEFSYQYFLYIYKLGVQPTKQLKMVIQHEKSEEYKHFKELYGKNYVEPKVINIKEVKAWEASDGTIFRYENEQMAINYENRLTAKGLVHSKYEEHKLEIYEHIAKLINKPVSEDEIGYEADGWDCKDSPIGKCIYNSDYDYECCVYCGAPEERK